MSWWRDKRAERRRDERRRRAVTSCFTKKLRRKPLCSQQYKLRPRILMSGNWYRYGIQPNDGRYPLFPIDSLPSPGRTSASFPVRASMLFLIGKRMSGYNHYLLVLWKGKLWATYPQFDASIVYEGWNAWFEPFGEYQGTGTPAEREKLVRPEGI